MSYLKIVWYNSVDIGSVLFQDGWKGKIYLDIEVERPDYNTTVESDMNGDNTEIVKFQRGEKVYKFECWMQEDLVDAFWFAQFCDTIEVTLQTGDTIYVLPGTFKIEYEWEEAGCLAKVTVSFIENYVAVGSCTENMDTSCYCDPVDGEFLKIEEYSTLGPGDDGDIELAWTIETIAGKKYVAELYELHKDGGSYYWSQLPTPASDSCYENQDDSTNWFYDGIFWRLMPGYIFSITYANPNATIKGWIPDGCFMTVYYDVGAGYVEGGTYTWENFEDLGIPIDIGSHSGKTVPFYLHVWNHSCDYGYTEEESIIITDDFKYGLLYNWYAATDVMDIANTDWHVPTNTECLTLLAYLNPDAGNDLKESGLIYWNSGNVGTNIAKFNGRGAGGRNGVTGNFISLLSYCYLWTSTMSPTPSNPYAYDLKWNSASFTNGVGYSPAGNSIRLIKDSTSLSPGESGFYTGNDGKIYRTICIGTQEWLADNLAETKYRTGADIPEETDGTAWAALITGALCAYDNDWNNV